MSDISKHNTMAVNEPDVELILKALAKLATPLSAADNGPQSESLERLIELNIESVQLILSGSPLCLDSSSIDCIYWRFVWWNAKLLTLLTESIKKALADFESKSEHCNEMSPDTLSFSSQQTIKKSIQFIVAFGIVPLLNSGVGLPLESRTKTFKVTSDFVEKLRETDRSTRENRLKFCVDALIQCCDVVTLSSLILPACLSDLLAGLLQLCFQPNSTLKAEDLKACEALLESVLTRADKRNVIKEMLVLMSGPPPITTPQGKRIVKVPVWLKKQCSSVMRSYIMESSGVKLIIQSLMNDTVGLSNEETSSVRSFDWRTCEAVAKVVVNCPFGDENITNYYQNIGQQILSMLQHKSDGVLFGRVLVSMLSHMRQSQPLLTDDLIANSIFSPLLMCTSNHSNDCTWNQATPGTVLVESSSIESAVNSIHKIFLMGCESHDHLVNCLKSVIPVLFSLYSASYPGISHIKQPLKELMVWIFNHLEVSAAMIYLKSFLCPCLKKGCSTCEGLEDLKFTGRDDEKFVLSDDRGMAAVKSDQVNEESEEAEAEIKNSVDAVASIVGEIKQEKLLQEFSLHCLKELTKLMSSDDVSYSTEIEEVSARDSSENVLWHKMAYFYLFMSMSEYMWSYYQSNYLQLIQFVKATLLHAVKVLDVSDDLDIALHEMETVSALINILTFFIYDEQFRALVSWDQLETLQPLLKKLTGKNLKSEIVNSAETLSIAIATHGFVKMDNLSSKKSSSENTRTKQDDSVQKVKDVNRDCKSEKYVEESKVASETITKSRRVLIEEISDGDIRNNACSGNRPSHDESKTSDYPESRSEQNHHIGTDDSASCKTSESSKTAESCTNSTDDSVLSEYRKTLQELSDPFLPVRGHGLIALRRLIQNNDSETLQDSDRVLELCRGFLMDDDTYIYLGAVEALAALSERRPAQVMQVVVSEYVTVTNKELQLKLGEVLVKITTLLGEMVPYHKDKLLNAVLTVIKTTDDELIKASAVSNLGQICENLRFSLGNCIMEIFQCVNDLLKFESRVSVRRSAAMLTSLLLRGLAKDTFKVMESILKDFYRLLKHTALTDKDDVVRLHVQISLEELDIIVKNYIFPKQTFTKRIHVLDPFTE